MSQFIEFDPTKQPRCKVELHVHLDGCVRLSTIWELAEKKGIKLDVKSLENLYDACCVKCPTTLGNFLKPFCIFYPVIVGDSEAIERIAYEFCEDAVKQGIFYCEVRYSPHLLCTAHCLVEGPVKSAVTARDVVMAINRGLSRGSADFKLTVRSILCCFRTHPEWSNEVLDLCVEFQAQGVVGIDIAGDEALGLATAVDIDVFKRAAALGIHRTVHAGEAGPASNVKCAISEMFAERIGHGYRVVDDPTIYEEARLRGIHFETCPYSSCLTGAVARGCPKHPIVQFAEDEVNFSISRDDPTLIQKTLDEEYEFLRSFGLKEVHIVRANFNAARCCFLPEDEKERLIQQLQHIYGTLPTLLANAEVHYIPPKILSGAGDF